MTPSAKNSATVTPMVVAIGGNALYDIDHGNNIDPMKLEAVSIQLADLVELGFQPIITFGNGPQVGHLLDMVESYTLPPKWPIPLDVCVSWTQAEIGYALTKALCNQLKQRNLKRTVIEVNTTVVVDSQDPAFLNPTKPIGMFYTEGAAQALAQERGWLVKADSNRGWRRVVPSPKPKAILEAEALQTLVDSGALVMCGGGGGIPIIDEDGLWRGIEAVIDKDFTACLIAKSIGAQQLIICTAIDQLYLHFGQPEQTALSQVGVEEAKVYLGQGQFPPGSMGPKVEALVDFVEHGGQKAMITLLENLLPAVQDKAGTRIVP